MRHPEQDTHNPAPTIIRVFVSSSPEDDRDGLVTELLASVASACASGRRTGWMAPVTDVEFRILPPSRGELAEVPADTDILLAFVSRAYFADPACRVQWEQFRAIEAVRDCGGEAIVAVAIDDPRHAFAADDPWWLELQSRGFLKLGSDPNRGQVGVPAEQSDVHTKRICRSMVCRSNLCQCIMAVQRCGDADPLATCELGRALLRVGNPAFDPTWSSYREVTRGYVKRAAAICDRLNAMAADLDPDVRFRIGILCHQLGMASFSQCHEPASSFRRAFEIFSSLEPNRSKNNGPEYFLASTLYALGCCHAQENRDLALDCLRKSLKWSGDLVAIYPDDQWLGQMHLETLVYLGNVQVEHHQNEEAVATYSKAIELSERFSPSEWHRSYLDRVLWSLSEVHVAAGRLDEARRIFDRLIDILTSDLRQSPDSIHAAKSLAGRLSKVASILHARGQQGEAIAMLEQALCVLDKCASKHAGDARVLNQMAAVRRHLRRALRERNELARAMTMSHEAPAVSEMSCNTLHVVELVTNSLGMTLAFIPAGTFMMGTPENEHRRSDDETQHQVTLTRGYYLGTTPVTQGQWKSLMGNNPSSFNGDDLLPVEQVSWNDAVEFCKRLSLKEGKRYRLPTEAEWEYACRAGTTTRFNTGASITTSQANFDGGAKGVSRQKTTRVGSFAPNAWGLYDMHGNVWEWCADWWDDIGKAAAWDPKGPQTGTARVVRGGSWFFGAGHARSASRLNDTPDNRDDNLGFRIALDSD